MFCAAGFFIGNWISPAKEVKNKVINKTTCQDNICPMPDNWDGNKNLKERR